MTRPHDDQIRADVERALHEAVGLMFAIPRALGPLVEPVNVCFDRAPVNDPDDHIRANQLGLLRASADSLDVAAGVTGVGAPLSTNGGRLPRLIRSSKTSGRA